MDPSFCMLIPELTFTLEEEMSETSDENNLRQQQWFQQTLLLNRTLVHDSSSDNLVDGHLIMPAEESVEINQSEISEGMLIYDSHTNASHRVSDSVANDKNDFTDLSNTIQQHSSATSSAYFSLFEEPSKSRNHQNTAIDNEDLGLQVLKNENNEINEEFQENTRSLPIDNRVFNHFEGSAFIPRSENSRINRFREVHLQPLVNQNSDRKMEDMSVGATDDDVLDWPSDQEEKSYAYSPSPEARHRERINFKDKPRGEPMGSESNFALTSLAIGRGPLANYRSTNYKVEIISDSDDELDLDVNRSYWLRGNIEGSDINVPLPSIPNRAIDDTVRPPLVGQSKETDLTSIQSSTGNVILNKAEMESETKDFMTDFDKSKATNDFRMSLNELDDIYDQDPGRNENIFVSNHRVQSPSVLSVSSVASSKRLEWDSGADIGYGGPRISSGLSTLEKMAISSSAMKKRMEPEGKSSLTKDLPVSSSLPLDQVKEKMNSSAETEAAEMQDIFKNVLVLRNSAFRSASLSDLSSNRNRINSSRQHSCSTTNIHVHCPTDATKLISSSSCSAVSTSSSNTVIGLPSTVVEGVLPISSAAHWISIPSGDIDETKKNFQSQPVELSSLPPLEETSGTSSGLPDNNVFSDAGNYDTKNIVSYTKKFVEKLCSNSDEERKKWLVKKILEDFGIIIESMSERPVTPSSEITSSSNVPLPPPPDFEDPVVPQITAVSDWDQSIDSRTSVSRVSSVQNSQPEILKDATNPTATDSEFSLNTVKEMQQQLASSFEYFDALKSNKNSKSLLSSIGNSADENVAWINTLKKRNRGASNKHFPCRQFSRHYNIDSSSDETCSTNHNIFVKLSPLKNSANVYSSESSASDYQVESTNSFNTMKRFIRRLDVVNTWHPEGVELVKDLIQKQRRSYIRRLQREVDWLERIEQVLSANSNEDSAPSNFKKKIGTKLHKEIDLSKRSKVKITKDFGQSYPTPISTDSERAENTRIANVQTCSVGVQTSVEYSNSLHKTTSPIKERKNFTEKERPVVNIPLSLSPQKSPSSAMKEKKRRSIKKPARKPVAWFLPFGNGQPKLLLGELKKIDAQTIDSSGTKARFIRLASSSTPLSLQESCSLFKSNAIKQSEYRQKDLQAVTELRKLVGSSNLQLENNYPHKLFRKVTVPLPISAQHHKPQRRTISHCEMREQTEKIYSVLPEIMGKNELKMRETFYRTNRLMASIFKKKLQGRVLKGQVSHLTTQKCV